MILTLCLHSVIIVLIPSIDQVKGLKIYNLFTPLPIHFPLNLNTNTECVNSLIVYLVYLLLYLHIYSTYRLPLAGYVLIRHLYMVRIETWC